MKQFRSSMTRQSGCQGFSSAQRKDVKNRACTCPDEIAFVLSREKDCDVLMKQLREGLLPLRVTHNNTKTDTTFF